MKIVMPERVTEKGLLHPHTKQRRKKEIAGHFVDKEELNADHSLRMELS